MGGATIAVASVSLAVVQTIATQHKVSFLNSITDIKGGVYFWSSYFLKVSLPGVSHLHHVLYNVYFLIIHLFLNFPLQMKHAVPCTACKGTGLRRCEICLGKGIIRARAPRTMRQMMQEARGGRGSVVTQPMDLICPACGSTLEQKCLNCVGKGKVF